MNRATLVRHTSTVTKCIALLLCATLLAYAEGNTFTRVRYNGGSVASKVDPKDWNNKLTVTPDAIMLDFNDKQQLVIPPKSVTSISYGQEAHRRVGTVGALAVLVAPVALFGVFHKTRLHYIGIQYNTPDGKNAGVLLQGDKDNYRAMLVALQGVTGAPVAIAEKDREFVPVSLSSKTDGADVYVADQYPLRFWIVTSMQFQRPNIISGGNSVTVTQNKSCSMSISDQKIRYVVRDTATAENRISWKRCWTGDPGQEVMGRRRGDHIELVVPDGNKTTIRKYEILQMSAEN